eukprot:scaffold1330_cov240-Pinguiococcus_pyrenoidosus.AAC.26
MALPSGKPMAKRSARKSATNSAPRTAPPTATATAPRMGQGRALEEETTRTRKDEGHCALGKRAAAVKRRGAELLTVTGRGRRGFGGLDAWLCRRLHGGKRRREHGGCHRWCVGIVLDRSEAGIGGPRRFGTSRAVQRGIAACDGRCRSLRAEVPFWTVAAEGLASAVLKGSPGTGLAGCGAHLVLILPGVAGAPVRAAPALEARRAVRAQVVRVDGGVLALHAGPKDQALVTLKAGGTKLALA